MRSNTLMRCELVIAFSVSCVDQAGMSGQGAPGIARREFEHRVAPAHVLGIADSRRRRGCEMSKRLRAGSSPLVQ